MNRCSEDLECLDLEDEHPLATLSTVQTDKLTLFFTELLDHDRDDVICDQDFDNFFEVSDRRVCDGMSEIEAVERIPSVCSQYLLLLSYK